MIHWSELNQIEWAELDWVSKKNYENRTESTDQIWLNLILNLTKIELGKIYKIIKLVLKFVKNKNLMIKFTI